MTDTKYFSHLYEIARSLNKEFSLHSALKNALEKTIQLFELETGWIWLMQSDRSVYLAASYNLPPALKDHPERLSGRCYCIERYFSNNIERAQNISEIACTRLHNVKSGTLDLKFHATVPINIGNEKVGLINLVSIEKQELNRTQLFILNTVGELIGIAVQRTRVQDINFSAPIHPQSSLYTVLNRVVPPKLEVIISSLNQAKSDLDQDNNKALLESINKALTQAEQLNNQIALVLNETAGSSTSKTNQELHYPTSPLTKRELELLTLVKNGHTNKQIAETLFISERTVKFHITSILSKLFANTRTEAVNIALKRGLISF